MKKLVDLKELVSLCKRRGMIFGGSEIYGGLANTFDYGPYGAELKRNIKDLWWKHFVHGRRDVLGMDSSIFMNPKTWEASGHLKNFSDPLMDCKSCKTRHRADHLLERHIGPADAAGKTLGELYQLIGENKIACPNCGSIDWTEPRNFNLMFKTQQGVLENENSTIYLRPETAQGIFVNFKIICDSYRVKVPFGIAQIGKSFRNEITPGNFVFRTREFEQMEMEYFVEPGSDKEWYEFWKGYCQAWLTETVGLSKESVRLREHSAKELSHYSTGTCDIEYQFPFGWGELWGIACRTDFDLKAHMETSNTDLRYQDKVKNTKYLPWVIEPSLGVERLVLSVLCDGYALETTDNGEERTVLRLARAIAPVKVAVLPLSKKPELEGVSERLLHSLQKRFTVEYDVTQSIGKRYRRQDEIGTPYCLTVDFETLQDDCVTIRERDSMEQKRISLGKVDDYLSEALK